MALVFGLPDFFNTDKPGAHDFNSVARAILEQIGGQAPGRSNLFTQSELFSDAAWTKTNATVVALLENDPSYFTQSPTDTQNGFTLTDDATNGLHDIRRTIAGLTIGERYSLSLHVKPGTLLTFKMYGNSSGSIFAVYDLSAGTVTTSSAEPSHAYIQSVRNGFFRCSLSFIATATSHELFFRMRNAAGTETYSGGTGTLKIFGACLAVGERGPGMYVPTTTATINESDYIELPGNLNDTNFTTTPGFRNSQKSEQRSVFTLPAQAYDITAAGVTNDTQGLIIGPVAFDCEPFAVGIVNDDTGAFINGGTLTAFVNGVQIITLTVPPATTNNEVTGLGLLLQLRAGDVVHFTQALTWSVSQTHKLRLVLFCTGVHTT